VQQRRQVRLAQHGEVDVLEELLVVEVDLHPGELRDDERGEQPDPGNGHLREEPQDQSFHSSTSSTE
jgi:hypothetical protein